MNSLEECDIVGWVEVGTRIVNLGFSDDDDILIV